MEGKHTMIEIINSISVNAETAAALNGGNKSLLILPYSKLAQAIRPDHSIAVLEPFLPTGDGGMLWAADYPKSFGWQPAHIMPPVLARMHIRLSIGKLVYDSHIAEQDMVADGIYRVGVQWAWQRLTVPAVLYDTASDAWHAAQAVAWGRTRATSYSTKSVMFKVTVERARSAVA